MTDSLTADLQELLGDDGFLQLVETYGGLSTYIAKDDEKSTLDLADEIRQKLIRRYGGTYLAVPIARYVCARHYRLRGLNNREIARKLRMTETAVRKMFARRPVKRPLRKRKVDDRQIDMFPEITPLYAPRR